MNNYINTPVMANSRMTAQQISNGCEVKRPSQVDDMITLVSQKLASQEEIIKHLQDRLKTVSKFPSPMPPTDNQKTPSSCSVPLAVNIESLAIILQSHNDNLTELLQMLDL